MHGNVLRARSLDDMWNTDALFTSQPEATYVPVYAACLVHGEHYKYAKRSFHPHLATMLRSLHLHSIRVKSLDNPHEDIQPDMPMFAQLIVDGNILKQTETMAPDIAGEAWKLKFSCKIPTEALIFSVAILRKNQGTRLLGSLEIARGEALTHAEQRTPLCQQFAKVNADGPALEFRGILLVSESSTAEPIASNGTPPPIQSEPTGALRRPCNISKIPLKFHSIMLGFG
ncbi:hypothetical protein B0H11DRAFT_1388670 [Mycena galericulata]|nr:hypothetical protein B0H11DRAFT_1388670 [Mycena galericulata]